MGNEIDIVPGVPNGQVHKKFEFVPSHHEGAKPINFSLELFVIKLWILLKKVQLMDQSFSNIISMEVAINFGKLNHAD